MSCMHNRPIETHRFHHPWFEVLHQHVRFGQELVQQLEITVLIVEVKRNSLLAVSHLRGELRVGGDRIAF